MSRSFMLRGNMVRERRKSMALTQPQFIKELIDNVLNSDDKPMIEWVRDRMKHGNPDPISMATLSKIENNGGNVDPKTARFIAVGMGVEVSDLLEDVPGEANEGEYEEDRYVGVPVVITVDLLIDGPRELDSVEMDEIMAVRLSDGENIPIGYSPVEEYALIRLAERWLGGDIHKLLKWGKVDAKTARIVYQPGVGLRIGPEGQTQLLVVASGTRIRLEYLKERNERAAKQAYVYSVTGQEEEG